MVHTTRIWAKHEVVMVLNDSFQQQTQFDSRRNIDISPFIHLFLIHL